MEDHEKEEYLALELWIKEKFEVGSQFLFFAGFRDFHLWTFETVKCIDSIQSVSKELTGLLL